MQNKPTSVFAKARIAMALLNSTSLIAESTVPAKPTSFEVSCYVTKAKKIRLALEKTTAERLQIALRQAGKKHVLFFQSVGRKDTKAAFLLDVDQLTNGDYELEIKSATGRIVKQVKLETVAPVVASERLLAVQ